MRGVIVVGLLVACTPKQPPPPQPPNIVATVDARAATTVDAAAPVVADAEVGEATVDAAPVAEPVVGGITVPDPIPAVKGPVTKLETKKTATIGGMQVTFSYSSHKSDGELGMWGFELARGGRKESFELRSESSRFEAEVDALGALLVFRHIDYNNFEIVLAAAKTPKPLDNDGCRAAIEKAATARKLTIDGSSSTGTEDGIIKMSNKGWVGYCGVYTRRIWFAPVREPRRRR
jgi:hypothetical protein